MSSRKFDSFDIAELALSIGTVELLNGSRNKSKGLFATALIDPNDNALAQVEWANSKESFFNLNVSSFAVQHKYEALTLESYNTKNWDSLLTNAEQWFIDMPFAKRPVIYGHHAASFFLEDQETAIKFCRAGLISNPNDPQIINNIAYSHAVLNQTKVALEYLNKVCLADVKEPSTRVCLLATAGLVHYRSGIYEKGRELYLDAISEAAKKRLTYYYNLAVMHFAKEEIAIGSKGAGKLYDQVLKIEDHGDLELQIFKRRITNLFDQSQQSSNG